MILTGNAVPLFRLLAARMVVRLCVRGVRVRHSAAWLRAMRSELGLSSRAKPLAVLLALDARIEEAAGEVRPGEVCE